MGTVLPAKLTRPKADALLPRDRLFGELDGDARCIWVAAPAGAGKTSLATSWIESRRPSCAWYRVDEGDADPATTFHYLAVEGKRRAGRRRAHLPALTPEYLPGLEIYVRRFFEQLFALFRPPFALVFDNCHEVPGESVFFRAVLPGALESLPGEGKVICLSREAPPSPLSRSTMDAGFRSLVWDDLRFSDPEAVALADRVAPGASQAATLNGLARGWVAGLKLLLRASPAEFSQVRSDVTRPQALFDYLAEEVFEQVPASTQEFLLRSALLPEMSGPTAQALTGNHESARILARLYSEQLFIERRQLPSGASYQFHP